VSRAEVTRRGAVPPLRRRLADAGIACYEADLRFAYRWLIDHDLRGSFAVEGSFERRPGVGRIYRNPTLTPGAWTPTLRVLSFDVETSANAGRLYSIAAAGAGGERVWIVRPGAVDGAAAVPDERPLLERFLAHVRSAAPALIPGWNVCDFALAVLLAACRRTGVRCALGRNDDVLELQRDQNYTRESRAVLA